MTKWILIILVVGILAVFLTFQMFSLGKVDCSLCVSFKDQRECVHALGPIQEQAMEEAHRNACALLSSGVTDVVACNRQPSENVLCVSK